jgi:phytoene dehydrogenase-like protein
MRAAVIGAGLGGLLSAAILAEKGFKVDVYEKLPFFGGRFTNIEYKKFQLSTGALHMIPHGKRGPLGQLLKKIGAELEIVDSKPEGEALCSNELLKLRKSDFPLGSRMKFLKWCWMYRLFRFDRSLDRLEKEVDEFSARFLRSLLGWMFSITPRDIKFSKFLPIYRSTEKYGGPGIPIGGCKSVIDALLEVIRSNDGNFVKAKVGRIVSSENTAIGIRAKEDKRYDIVISNVGHSETAKMLGDKSYEDKTLRLEPSSGVKYSLALDEPFIGHTGVLLTLETTRISGMNEVTNADPNLAPNGKHLLMAHQPILTSNLRYEISLGLKDLKRILKGYSYEVLAIQSYSDGWPVNRVKAGSDVGNKTPYKNLYVVGDGAKGNAVEVDGIAAGIADLMGDLL